MSTPTATDGVAAASDEHCREMDELHFTIGEGPSHDAYRTRRPVMVPDLNTAVSRWPGYVSAVIGAGVAGVFVFPLHVGATGLGMLSVFTGQPGSFSDEQTTMALTFAEMATDLLLDQATTAGGEIDPGLESALGHRWEIYQAQGMVAVALDLSLLDALVRMRALAFSKSQPLIELAQEIVNDRHRLDEGL